MANPLAWPRGVTEMRIHASSCAASDRIDKSLPNRFRITSRISGGCERRSPHAKTKLASLKHERARNADEIGTLREALAMREDELASLK
jgi:hypothetical protein